MRIGINAAQLVSRLAGVGYYTLGLVRHLPQVAPDVEWIFFGAGDGSLIPVRENVRAVLSGGLNARNRPAWEQIQLPRLAARERVDLLHCTDFSRPFLCSVPVINTLHDLSYYSSEGFFPAAKVIYKRILARQSVRRSGLIADSEFTRRELEQRFHVPPGRIHVIYPGIDVPSNSERMQPAHPFILFVGTLEKRKNIVTLVDAFTQLKREDGIPHKLILVGSPGFEWAAIRDAIAASHCQGDIEIRGYLDRAAVLRLYRSSDLFVFPSFYEGFGFPVLEAMACGTPVVCSSSASLPEAGGDAAIYFEPRSTESLKSAMRQVLASPELRASLQRKGRIHASRFTWIESARQHYAAYGAVLNA